MKIDPLSAGMRLLGALLVSLSVAVANGAPVSGSNAYDDSGFAEALKNYVRPGGKVDYRGLKEHRAGLDRYIQVISEVSPDRDPKMFPAKNEQLAYWINAYNAWILRTVIDNYPITSITKVGLIPFSVFMTNRITLGGRKMSFHALETDILRGRFQDPRIHFAINCASASCPPLSAGIYRPVTLDQQLNSAAVAFINDNRNVTLDAAKNEVVLSKIFDWYKQDFVKAAQARFHRPGSVIQYLTLYLDPRRLRMLQQMQAPEISFHPYDWSLNEARRP